MVATLHLRHNDHDGVSNHQPHGCLLHSLFKAQIKENIKALRHWPLCGEFTGIGEFPAQRASYAEKVSIWWRHHVLFQDQCDNRGQRQHRGVLRNIMANFIYKKKYINTSIITNTYNFVFRFHNVMKMHSMATTFEGFVKYSTIILYWKTRVVMMPTLPSLVAPLVVIATT